MRNIKTKPAETFPLQADQRLLSGANSFYDTHETYQPHNIHDWCFPGDGQCCGGSEVSASGLRPFVLTLLPLPRVCLLAP